MIHKTRTSERSKVVGRLLSGAWPGALVVVLLACHAPPSAAPVPVPGVPASPQQERPPLPLPPPPSARTPDFTCDPLAGAGRWGDSLTVVATASIGQTEIQDEPTAAHRFVFRRAYQSLVTVDCRGDVFPGVAASWSRADSGAVQVRLRSDARFWSGHVVRAGDVLAGWSAFNDSLARALSQSTIVIDDSTLIVPVDSANVKVLGSAHLRVMMPLSIARWPLGTGTHRIVDADLLHLEPIALGGRDAFFRIRTATLADARDAIDNGADIVLTGDSVTAAYAARRLSADVIPLEWDRTWSLAITQTVAANAAQRDTSRWDALRRDLVRDVLRANARVPATPGWTMELPSACPALPRPSTRGRLAYRSEDPVARAIAERLVAVGSVPALAAAARVTAAPLAADAFQEALRDGAEVAFVTSAPFRAARCTSPNVIPLVDTRWQAVVGRSVKRAP